MPNEKTLEMNITYEILNICRLFDPRAFAFGTTLVEERDSGFDSRTVARLPRSWLTSPLQYKRAKKVRTTVSGELEYTFDINNNSWNDQHTILYHYLAGGRRNVAFYILPAIFTDGEFYSSLPNLLDRTWLVDVVDIDPWFVGRNRHEIHLFPQLRAARLHSDSIREISLLTLEKFKGLVTEGKIGLPIEEIRRNMKQKPKQGLETASKRPRFLLSIMPGR